MTALLERAALAVADTTCRRCEAEPGQRCITRNGRPTSPHQDRLWPISHAWWSGYAAAVRDLDQYGTETAP